MALQWPTILLFFAFLLLPSVNQITGYPRVAPLEEYRQLAPRPDPATYFNANNFDLLGFTGQLNAWHSDQFGTRPVWVRLRTQALYSIFGESDQVHVGKNGWLFYRSVIDIETPSLERITGDGRNAFRDKLARLTELLDARGVRLYIMPLTLKHRFYPEHLPPSAQHAEAFRFYDQMLDELAADDRVRLIDTRAILEDAKAGGLKIYHQTDFHWTDAAAPLAARELIRDIGAQENAPQFVENWSYEVVTEPFFRGGQARALPLFRAPTEETVSVSLTWPQTLFTQLEGIKGLEAAGRALPNQGLRFQPILVYGDSFFDAQARAGFFNFFSAYGRGRLFQNDLTDAYRNRLPGTRYMVLEWISSATFGMDNYVTALIAALEADDSL